ncbi:hypothetical protein MA20_25955 [Bradyrhizobium japonicum]|uniref:Uncharacterized protein n=2 Tax=Nitrobacteraceae TaxID=41294 RepID=A0A0A3XSV9_BRAJP|nr:hypothetical protein MA20_25955 [Bradyrhizobium japonicum]
MNIFSATFRTLKNVMGGFSIREMNTLANYGYTKMSLRLKQNDAGEYFVVLAELSAGNSQFVSLTTEEFGQFADAVFAMRDALRERTGTATA